MNMLKSINYLPPNLREYPLYENVTDVLDRVVDNVVYPELDKLKNLYNPAHQAYSPADIIKFLGSSTLGRLLTGDVDETSVSMLLSDLDNIKGTKEGFELILRFLDLKTKNIIYTQLEDGCTEVTIVFEDGQRVSLNQVVQLESLSREIFPLCLALKGLTNCKSYVDSSDYSGNVVTLGTHKLSRDFTLDLSKLSYPYGHTENSVSQTIRLLLCNFITSELFYGDEAFYADTVVGHHHIGDLIYSRNIPNVLDVNLTLDRFDTTEYYMFVTTSGRITAHDLIYDNDSFSAQIRHKRQNVFSFILDDTKLSTAELNPLDGEPDYTWTDKSLSRNFILGQSLLDRGETHVDKHIALYRHGFQIDLDAVTTPVFGSVPDNSAGNLDYRKKHNINFIPALM